MITAIVRFTLPQDTSLDAVREVRAQLPERARPGAKILSLRLGEDRIGGGVYLWESREAAERMYSDAWKKSIAEKYGNPPQITYYETTVIVDNSRGKASVDAA